MGSGGHSNEGSWLDAVAYHVYELEVVTLPDVDLDFSPTSLDQVEAALLSRLRAPTDLRGFSAGPFTAYLGETLLRVAGGGWRADVPVIEADATLDLPAIAPIDLIRAAVSERTGHRLRDAYGAWARAVSTRRADLPTWLPVKRPTPGVDEPDATEAERRHLREWVTARKRAFPYWVSESGLDVDWDFSAASLDALAALTLRLTPNVPKLEDAGNSGFVDGATWYLGETLRRVRGGRWRYRDGDPQANLFQGHPYVEQFGPDPVNGVPFRALRVLVRRGDPGHLRRRYETFAT